MARFLTFSVCCRMVEWMVYKRKVVSLFSNEVGHVWAQIGKSLRDHWGGGAALSSWPLLLLSPNPQPSSPYVSRIASPDPILWCSHCSLRIWCRRGHSCQWNPGCEYQSPHPKIIWIWCQPRCWRLEREGRIQGRKRSWWTQSRGQGRGSGLCHLPFLPSFETRKVLLYFHLLVGLIPQTERILVGWAPWWDWGWVKTNRVLFENKSVWVFGHRRPDTPPEATTLTLKPKWVKICSHVTNHQSLVLAPKMGPLLQSRPWCEAISGCYTTCVIKSRLNIWITRVTREHFLSLIW